MPILTPIDEPQLVADVRALAAALTTGGWAPDTLVGIGRGGLVPAVYLSHATGIAMLSVDYSSQDDALATDAIAALARRTQAGEALLFLDDINDTGRTIGQLRAMLAAAGADAARVRFAVLIDNAVSGERVEYRARTIDRTVTKDWFVFPWEAVAPAEAIADDAAEFPDRIA